LWTLGHWLWALHTPSMFGTHPRAQVDVDLSGFHAGSEDVIRGVYLAHAAVLLRAARHFAGAAEAEAVVHDVFVELLRNRELREQFTGGALAAWLRQIARLKALEHLRRTRRQPPSELGEAPGSNEAHLEARNALMRFLEVCVPERQKPFFSLRFLGRQTQVEVAARLGIPRSTLEGWEHSLSERLRAFVLGNP
jgi:RNA polymerase sigma factor (sigma-70 family)